MSNNSPRRREILAAAAAAPLILSSSAKGANERITFALIGAGRRGRRVTQTFIEFGGAKLLSVCDVYKPNLGKGLEIGGADAQGYVDYKEVLARDDIDAVLIATPDHHHAPMLINAVKAGKDVYCEKPMTHSISEGVRVIREVRATDRIVQIGMQRRSTPWIIETKKMVDDGLIGDILAAKAQWNWIRLRPLNNSQLEGELDWKRFVGRAAYRRLEPMRFRSWRNFWDYSGGNITDQGTHLMDVIQWLSNSGTPKSATCLGKVFEMHGAETPDVFSAAYEYRNLIATWTLNYNNDYQNGWTIRLEGTKGTLILDGSGYRVYQAPWKYNREPIMTHEGRLPTPPHVQNFLNCVKSREQPNAPVEVGHSAVCGPHLANIAFHTKRVAYLNPTATEAY